MRNNEQNILFDKFEIIACLKKDAGSAVYLANHVFLSKQIVLKTLCKDALVDQTILQRFQREAKTLAKLDHPNIIKVLDFGTFANNFYLSFEYFPARNLREVALENQLSVEEKTKIFLQIVKGLAYAHGHQIIHRDIKPENILVGASLQVKIADFGLALTADDSVVTNKSSIVGTPGYMSPEQIRGEALTPQSDLFALGIVAYELFTGRNPFLGKDVSATLNNILTGDEAQLFSDLGQTPPSFQPVLQGLLQRSRNKRTASAEAVLRELGIEAEEPPPSKPSLAKKPRLNRALAYLAAAVVLLVIIVLATTIFKSQKETTGAQKAQMINPPVSVASGDSLMAEMPSAKEEREAGLQATNEGKVTKVVTDSGTATSIPKSDSNVRGKLFVQCSPWAAVYLDEHKIATTPLEDSIRIYPGEYELRLQHPEFPPYVQKIAVRPMETVLIQVRLDTLCGYLDCQVYPWGEVSIDRQYHGQTPLPKPIPVTPGRHLLTVTNPAFGKMDEYVQIERKDTLHYKLNMETLVKVSEADTALSPN